MFLIGAHFNAPVNGTVMLLIGAHCNNCPRMNGTVMFLIGAHFNGLMNGTVMLLIGAHRNNYQ